jgi:hypothetical protein
MNGTDALVPELNRWQQRALLVGGAALAACAAGAFLSPSQFFRSYLIGYLFWIGLALGSTAILMLHHLVGGNWGFVIRRPLESATRTLPLLAALMAPLLLGLPHLYLWAQPAEVARDPVLQHKALYLNVPFFVARAVLYFGIWIVLAYFLNRWSFEQDRTGDASTVRRLQLLSGPGLVLYGLTVTFASVDWVMSLEPHWFSTIYGVLFMIGQGLLTLAFATALLLLLSRHEPLAGALNAGHFHDLGNLMLAFVMLWAYIAVSQFLIIWSANLPEEIPWFLRRLGGGWQWVALVLALFHFAVPFLLLLSRDVKRRAEIIGRLALALIAVRLADLYWMVSPAFQRGFALHWMDVAAPLGIGGVWLAYFMRQLKRAPLLPLHDPRFSNG